jgi:glycosyltransferase involved in cell wall biosynthesis
MTSRAEACPNIVLEALANGAIAVSTDHPPMPEFFGDAALYYRERNASHLAARLAQALSLSFNARGHLRDSARARAEQFTWEATARATVNELSRAIELRAR